MFQILLTVVARITVSRPLDPCVLIAGVKIWADNPILTLLARGSSKFRFSFRDKRARSVVLPLHLHVLIYRRHVMVEVRHDDRPRRQDDRQHDRK